MQVQTLITSVSAPKAMVGNGPSHFDREYCCRFKRQSVMHVQTAIHHVSIAVAKFEWNQ